MLGQVFLVGVTIILLSGFLAGCICKRFKISPLIGYLLVGALIGPGGLDLLGANKVQEQIALQERVEHAFESAEKAVESVEEELESAERLFERESEKDAAPKGEKRTAIEKEMEERQEFIDASEGAEKVLEGVTEFGVLLLLFAIGIEFTFDKLTATAKYMFLGGILQMGLTIGLTIVVCNVCNGIGWVGGLALGSVAALSSTALVYKSLEDAGLADSKRAQATLGLLIFQDIALVPLLLILPRVLGIEADESGLWISNPWIDMTIKSALFCGIVIALKIANMRLIVPWLAKLQTNDMVVLYAIIVLLGMCVVAFSLGLTPALGALAAGVALGENRLTHQIDALVMPFREAFSAMFFISLGMLTDFSYVFGHPIVCVVALVGAVAFKALCASLALRVCGMDSRGALAFGTSIAQIGELAFMILTLARTAGAIEEDVYDTMLFVSVASLVITPNMVKIATTKFGMKPEVVETKSEVDSLSPELREKIAKATGHAVVIGAGHIGKRVADELISLGANVCLVDFNPVNLHPFNQNGIPTVTGDGADQNVLRSAGIFQADVLFVTVPIDDLPDPPDRGSSPI